jgi:CheY-like chemotaxis protein
LEGLGLHVHTLPDLAAVNRFEQEPLSAVLVDVPRGAPVPHAPDVAARLVALTHLDTVTPPQVARVNKPIMQRELVQVLLSRILDDSSPREEHPASEPQRVAAPLRVLLADDSPVNQEVAVGLLEYKGFEVCVANNGLEVIDAVRREQFAVVLMDLEMPELDGYAATAAIRAAEAEIGRSTPIIAMTAHATHAIQQRCREAGMNGHVAKPVDPQKLFQAIEDVLAETDSPPNARSRARSLSE